MGHRASTTRIRGAPVAVLAAAAAALLLVLLVPLPASAQTSAQGPSEGDAAASSAAETTTLEARRGDGIWHLLRRAGRSPTSEAIRTFRALNEERLLPGGGLVAGRSYEVPAADRSGASLHPIFGPGHERVASRSDRLGGHVYYIASGHGGSDPGTLARYGGRPLPEDEIAYDVALRLARRLLEEGATVHLVVQDRNDGIRDGSWFHHDDDERYLDGGRIARSQRRRLRDRVRIINRLYEEHRGTAKSQRFLSLHVDARGGRYEPQIDVHFLVASRSASRFAEVLRSTFRSRYAAVQPGRGYDGTVAFRNLYVLRHSRPVATVVELGNIRNSRDQARLTRASNRQAVAEWLLQGLLTETG